MSLVAITHQAISKNTDAVKPSLKEIKSDKDDMIKFTDYARSQGWSVYEMAVPTLAEMHHTL